MTLAIVLFYVIYVLIIYKRNDLIVVKLLPIMVGVPMAVGGIQIGNLPMLNLLRVTVLMLIINLLLTRGFIDKIKNIVFLSGPLPKAYLFLFVLSPFISSIFSEVPSASMREFFSERTFAIPFILLGGVYYLRETKNQKIFIRYSIMVGLFVILLGLAEWITEQPISTVISKYTSSLSVERLSELRQEEVLLERFGTVRIQSSFMHANYLSSYLPSLLLFMITIVGFESKLLKKSLLYIRIPAK